VHEFGGSTGVLQVDNGWVGMIGRIDSLLRADELSAFEEAVRAYPERCVRPRIDRMEGALPFETQSVPWFAGGRRMRDSRIRPGQFLEYAVADYYIQDAASLLPLALADIQPNDHVCDVCAAPGGKATAVAERLGADGVLVANEVIRSRLDVLRYSLARTGRANYAVCNLDPDTFSHRFSACFDKILLDVPCSGQTLLGKAKQNEAAFSERQIEHCAARAQRILEQSAGMLKMGGLLILSTCTFAIEENEDQIAWLLQRYPGVFEPVIDPRLEPWASPLAAGCYRLWPHRDSCAGGFAAALRRVGDHPIGSQSQGRGSRSRPHAVRQAKTPQGVHRPSQRESQKVFVERRRKLEQSIAAWGDVQSALHWRGEGCVVVEPGMQAWLEQHGDEGMMGSQVAIAVGNHIEPAHSLALLLPHLFRPRSGLELPDSSAMAYLAGEALAMSDIAPEGVDGSVPGAWVASTDGEAASANARTSQWEVATWRGKPLGWLKRSAGRWNNHLPSWARLRNGSESVVE
jgi:16S rRNA C967 or C1407 C5-methylase (RsmB/RsmF family)